MQRLLQFDPVVPCRTEVHYCRCFRRVFALLGHLFQISDRLVAGLAHIVLVVLQEQLVAPYD